MSIERPRPTSTGVWWAQEWQRLSLTATIQAMQRYLRGCADVTMARSPQHALAELHKTQMDLLRHSVDTMDKALRLWDET